MSRTLVISLVLVGVGCGTDDSPPTVGDDGGGESNVPAKNAAEGVDPATLPVLEVTAVELSRAFQTDAEQAAKDYEGRRLRLSGAIDSIPLVRSIHLTGWKHPDRPLAGWVEVESGILEPMPPWMATLHPTREVTLEGICEGETRPGFGPVVSQPQLVEVGPGPSIELASTALAEAYVADPDEAESKYGGQWIELTGTVVDDRDGDEYLAGAKTDDGETIPVRCLAKSFESVIGPGEITPGDVLVIHGECSGLTGVGDAVLVERAVVVSRTRGEPAKDPVPE